MKGQITKVDMTHRLYKIKTDISRESSYPKWDRKERDAAQQALNCVLDILDEYRY
jgi:hypothetical protein